MEAATDYTPASDGREPEHLDMKRGDLLRVYRANNGQFTESILRMCIQFTESLLKVY